MTIESAIQELSVEDVERIAGGLGINIMDCSMQAAIAAAKANNYNNREGAILCNQYAGSGAQATACGPVPQ